MSYHILHQFDEQWFGDNGRDKAPAADGFSRSRGEERDDRTTSRKRAEQRPWVITILSLIIAAGALYFATDARRQNIELQQRITELEARLKR